ncbi:anti-sigma B factor antagonist [Thermoclostridium caenicola]|uniref:Anti-sigma factor antagonist n=2 Tax=Thermoclostridium caenicola TaxID=659425 RepID=A0A1M6IAH0_9FIRM|nr:anti-sigma B factor antagonist [Thermoclostridium caenicola]HPU22026.1 STAS domain-containing protein [Thermoclostridium caenicola]
MEFRMAERDGFTIASIEGQVRISTQNEFMEHMDTLFQTRGSQTVLLDMEKVSYMNSAGIGIIVDTFKKFRDNGGRLVLCGLIPNINRLFEVTRLNRFIQIYPSVEEALHTLKNS